MGTLSGDNADGHTSRRVADRSIGLMVTLGLFLALQVILPSDYNWDLLGYVGVVYSFTEDDPEVIHARTYSEVKANVPFSSYQALIGESLPENSEHRAYRLSVAADPHSFVQQLPFYSVKPAYPALMFLLSKTGMDLVTASQVISITASLLIVVLLYAWLSRHHQPVTASILTLMLMPLATMIADSSSPDAFSNFLLLSAFSLLIERRAVRLALLLTIISIAVRPDNVILCFLLATYIAVFDSRFRIRGIGTALVGIGLYLILAKLSGNYGWPTLFYHSFVEPLTEPAVFSSQLSLREYLALYIRYAQSAYVFGCGLLLYALAILFRYKHSDFRDIPLGLLAVNFLYMIAHWLVYPHFAGFRFFVASYLMMLVVLTLRGHLRSEKSS